MHAITSPLVEQYLFRLATRYDHEVLNAMEAFGRTHDFPIVDRLVGVVLMVLTKLQGAHRVFEMGSGFGYSAYWFARGVGKGGHVYCTEGDSWNIKEGEAFLKLAELGDRVTFQQGEAIQLLKAQPGPFDIIFNDIDKGAYPEAWQVARGKLRPGGLYLADNTLWSGRVAEELITDDVAPGWTEAIKRHNEMIYADNQFEVTLLPIRDGLIVARRKE